MPSCRSFILSALSLLALGCSGGGGPTNGAQQCAPQSEGRRCPEGYVCQADDRCWRTGTGPKAPGTDGAAGSTGGGRMPGMAPNTPGDDPPDGAAPRPTPDASPPDAFVPMASLPSPSAAKQVPGGGRAQSPNYSLVKTTGQPSSGKVMESPKYRLVRGVVGATQR